MKPASQAVERLAFVLVVLAAGCTWDPNLDGYIPCGDGCPDGCTCLAGEVCVPDAPGLAPDFCGQPDSHCTTNEDCDHGCLCQNGACVPPHETPDADFCLHGETTCTTHDDCRIGCTCLSGVCTPPDDDPNYAYCAGEGQELTCKGPTYTVFSEEQLRGLLAEYAEKPGPHGIIFEVPGGELAITADLPPLTSLTWISGGEEGLRLAGAGATNGLIVAGTGVVLHDLTVVGFPGNGVLVQGQSADVHLYRMRIGEVATPNGTGIRIEPGAERITVGRGRELGTGRCVGFEMTDYIDGGNLADYDVNVIVGNSGDGIAAEGVTGLLVEGSWVGFDTVGDRGQGGWERGNQGTGIHLHDVRQAHVGLLHLDPNEMDGDLDYRQGCVAVGRSGTGGVHVQGGGDIRMHCLIVGDTPVMNPWKENHGFGLRIEHNTDPVVYGPAADATGFAAAGLGLVHTETVPALEIVGNEAPVSIRGAQFQSYWQQGMDYPASGVVITDIAAPVEITHVDLVGDVLDTFIRMENPTDDGLLRFVNNVVFDFANDGVPVMAVLPETAQVEMHHNLKWNYGPWCDGECPFPIEPEWSVEGDVGDCLRTQMKPLSPECPMVDRADDTGMDVNGPYDGRYGGCCPDLGAFECMSDACQSVDCDNVVCP